MMGRVRFHAALATMLAALVAAGGGIGASNGNGNSGDAPGQDRAAANCQRVIEKQDANDVAAGGGPKKGIPGPANCDHGFTN